MANENGNKIKLLVLWDILCKNTDENHAMNADEIREELEKRGISVMRKVVATDIAALNNFGYEVVSNCLPENRIIRFTLLMLRQANQALWKECFFVAVLRDFAHTVYARATSLPNPVTARLTANEKSRKRKAFAEIECNGHSKQITRQCKCAALVRMHNLFCVDASHFEQARCSLLNKSLLLRQ